MGLINRSNLGEDLMAQIKENQAQLLSAMKKGS